MSTINTIAVDKLLRLVGTGKCPAILDIRSDADFAKEPRLLPSSIRKQADKVAQWGPQFSGRNVIVACRSGGDSGPGVAAWLRQSGYRRAARRRDADVTALRHEIETLTAKLDEKFDTRVPEETARLAYRPPSRG